MDLAGIAASCGARDQRRSAASTAATCRRARFGPGAEPGGVGGRCAQLSLNLGFHHTYICIYIHTCICTCVQIDMYCWNGMEWNGMEWHGMEWNVM